MSLYEHAGLWVLMVMLSLGGLGVALMMVAVGILLVREALGVC